jgi:transcriptional regulator with XRE-family HTH domain
MEGAADRPLPSRRGQNDGEADGCRARGGRLRTLREQAGLTQAQLGEWARVAPAELSKMENGRRSPTLETLARLARTLEVPLAELVRVDDVEPVAADVERLVRRLRGQPADVVRRAVAVVDALIDTR